MDWFKKAQLNRKRAKLRSDGEHVLLGKNTKPGEGPWRVSWIDRLSKPAGHLHFKTYEEALTFYDGQPGNEVKI